MLNITADSSGVPASHVSSNDGSIEVVFSFSEDIKDFDKAHIEASEDCGDLTDVVGNTIPGREYRVKLNAKHSVTDANCTLSVLGDKFHDVVGNPIEAI